MTGLLGKAVARRAEGKPVSVPQALGAACVAGITVAALTYKLLRHGGGGD